MKRPTSKKKAADVMRSPLTSDTPLPSQSLIEQGGDPSVPSLAYVAALPEWAMIRDIFGGSRRIRAAGELYLPRFMEERRRIQALRVRSDKEILPLLGRAFEPQFAGLTQEVLKIPLRDAAGRDIFHSIGNVLFEGAKLFSLLDQVCNSGLPHLFGKQFERRRSFFGGRCHGNTLSHFPRPREARSPSSVRGTRLRPSYLRGRST